MGYHIFRDFITKHVLYLRILRGDRNEALSIQLYSMSDMHTVYVGVLQIVRIHVVRFSDIRTYSMHTCTPIVLGVPRNLWEIMLHDGVLMCKLTLSESSVDLYMQ